MCWLTGSHTMPHLMTRDIDLVIAVYVKIYDVMIVDNEYDLYSIQF